MARETVRKHPEDRVLEKLDVDTDALDVARLQVEATLLLVTQVRELKESVERIEIVLEPK